MVEIDQAAALFHVQLDEGADAGEPGGVGSHVSRVDPGLAGEFGQRVAVVVAQGALIVDLTWLVASGHHPASALFDAARVVATVGPAVAPDDPAAPGIRIARSLGIPVLTGHGGDRAVLEQLRLHKARALAAVGSDDLDNIAVAIAAHGVAPDTGVVLRAGEHEAIVETRSLLPLGTVRDVNSLAAAYVPARMLGTPATGVIAHRHRTLVQLPVGTFELWPLAARRGCAHVTVALSG